MFLHARSYMEPTEMRPFEILLAEDSQADVELIREALLEHGIPCSLKVISDGTRAIEFLNKIDTDPKAPALDLLLLDMRLPGSDGDEVLSRLRATERYAQTPVIMMTGLSSASHKEGAVQHNATTYFEKPSTLEEFMRIGAIIRRVLEQSGGRTAERAKCKGAT